MKAAVLMKPHDLHLIEKPMPELADDNSVIMKVRAVGICGSDVHAYHGKLVTVTFPRIIGHEVVGEIVAIGSTVSNVAVGDHAVLDPVLSCGTCPTCRKGRQNVCGAVQCMGVAAEGGCAEYIHLPSKNVYPIPKDIAWRDAVLMEPYSIAAQVVSRGEVAAGDTVLIMGAGPIGLVILQAAKRLGAKVIVTDLVPERLALACQLNADMVINPSCQDVVTAVTEFTDGVGVDVAIDAVGLPQLFEQALNVTVPAGRIVIIGLNASPAQVPEMSITRKELDIRGSRLHANKFPDVISWFAKKEVKTSPLVSHEFSLEDIQAAFDLLEKSPEKTCKVILTFNE